MELRYEDVAQDGRVTLSALPHAVGEVVWRNRLADHESTRAALKQGILPILTRLVIEASEETIAVTPAVRATGGFDLAHDVDAQGEVERLFLDIFVDVRGTRGRTHVPTSAADGADVAVGRVFAEHIFTRPWGPPEGRKVKSLDVAGYPPVPERRRKFRPLHEIASLPAESVLLDREPVIDPSPIVFGVMHTDSNQHVNSLVYLRLFEEALIRRHGARTALSRWVEIGYRKPCFAGDRVRVRLQAFTRGDEIGAIGAFVPEDDPETQKPYAYVAMGAKP
jgi:hypothetical protein